MTSTLYNANQLAKQLLPNGSEFDLAHVSAALENIVEWKVERGASPTVDFDEIVREVKEMNMGPRSKDAIILALRTVRNARFTCEWVLPEFRFNKSGFRYKVCGRLNIETAPGKGSAVSVDLPFRRNKIK